MTEALDDIDEGIKVGGQLIKEIRFADDQAMADSVDGLQQLMDSLSTKAAAYNMRINTKKTKTVRISGKVYQPIRITLCSTEIEQFNALKYLGVNTTADGRCTNI